MGIQIRARRYSAWWCWSLTIYNSYSLKSNRVAGYSSFRICDRRTLLGWLGAAIIFARAALPMPMMMPVEMVALTICGAHGIETILVDQNMNRVNPDAPPKPSAEHCGVCTLAFGLAWAIALTLGLALIAFHLLPRRDDVWPTQRRDFALAHPRAPPSFA